VKNNYHLYLGKAGHLIVMSEFLLRGWNVAIPEIDIGDDIFVVQDESGTLRRVQVKTSNSTKRQKGFSGRFKVPLRQLRNLGDVPVHYAFIVRHLDQWTKPIIIRQDVLLNFLETENIGSIHNEMLNLYFAFSDSKIECSKIDLTEYTADFTDFPLIED
jgi:hypothetical protein